MFETSRTIDLKRDCVRDLLKYVLQIRVTKTCTRFEKRRK